MSYVKGEVTYQIYFNNENNYGVYKVKIEETDEAVLDFHETVTITGYFQTLDVGSIYMFKGSMSFKNKYGHSFSVNTYERVLPTSREGIIEYLSGDYFKGIGKKTAELIVDTIGLDCIGKILSDKSYLDLVPSLNDKKKDILYETLKTNRELENIFITLYSYDITPNMAMKIYDVFKEDTIDVIKNNPYKLINEVEGIAFLKADKIALKTGISLYNDDRIDACIKYTILLNAEESGDTYISYDYLVFKTRELLSFDEDDDSYILKSIKRLKDRRELIDFGDEYISHVMLYNSEKYIADKLTLMASCKVKPFFTEEIKSLIEYFEKNNDIVYEEEQKMAIYGALNNNVSIITGGPGTGKTTIERGILFVYSQLISSDAELIKLCAPTGKAAKRIEESTGYTAKTIHKLLGYDVLGNFTYNKFNPLDAKLIIIDEASMIDIFLFKRLLEALPIDTKVVIIGDSDQLPSIGPGEVLKNIIESGNFHVTKLNKIHRQKSNSKIISLAYDCLKGEISTEIDSSSEDLMFIPAYPEDLNSILVNTINHFSSLGYSLLNDIQILIPMYKSIVGIENVNNYIQMTLNNYVSETDELNFSIDDKVIQLVNEYDKGVMNGDIGIVSDVTDNGVKVDFSGNIVSYTKSELTNIQLAYSISIHKAQGSEFPVVILPFFNNYRALLNKKLVYTAITRSKEHLVIIGSAKCFKDTIKILAIDRKTMLPMFLSKDDTKI